MKHSQKRVLKYYIGLSLLTLKILAVLFTAISLISIVENL